MVKEFKTYNKIFEYESYHNRVPNFEEGDSVICIDDSNCVELEKGKKYQVTNIYRDNIIGKWAIEINGVDGGFFASRFISEYKHDANKYNI